MSKTLAQLLALYPGFVPTPTDGVLVHDAESGIDKAALLSTLPAINGSLYKILFADDAGANNASAQPWFPTAGGVTLEANKTYMFSGLLRTSRAAGNTSHTTSLLFGGTATLRSILYNALVNSTDVVTNQTMNQTQIEVATATVVKAASTSTTEQIVIRVSGIVRTNAAGTFIPQFQYSAIPGGAPTIMKNSWFQLIPIGASDVINTSGTWA